MLETRGDYDFADSVMTSLQGILEEMKKLNAPKQPTPGEEYFACYGITEDGEPTGIIVRKTKAEILHEVRSIFADILKNYEKDAPQTDDDDEIIRWAIEANAGYSETSDGSFSYKNWKYGIEQFHLQ